MHFIEQIARYIPHCAQETQDQKVILDFTKRFPHTILLRENEIAHITSSGFIMNPSLNRMLMIHHNIRNTWAWTGGHADGEPNLLAVAIKEAKEETGIKEITLLSNNIASIDILPVFGHRKNGKYVNAHLHLSIAYLLIACETETLTVKKDENTAVDWITPDQLSQPWFHEYDIYLYTKLIKKARQIATVIK